MSSEPQVKGVAFETVLRELRRLRGDVVADHVVDLLSANGSVVGTSAFLASDDGQVIRELGRAAVLSDVPRLYRGLLRLLSPTTIAEQGARYFRRFYDTGSFTVVSDDEPRIEARFAGCHGFDRNMWVDVSGSIEGFSSRACARWWCASPTAAGTKSRRRRSSRGGHRWPSQ